jgi:hypothetical protein
MAKIVNPIIVTSGGGDSAEKLKQLASGTLTELTAKDLDGVTAIDEYFCYNNPTLTKIEIPDSVTTLNQYAFFSCDKVSEVIFNNATTTIQLDALYYLGSSSNPVTITLSDNLKDFTNNSDWLKITYNPYIKTLNIGKNLSSISAPASKSYRFMSQAKLTEVNWYCETEADFTSSLFYQTGDATQGVIINIGENVTKIGNYALQGIDYVKEINMPNGLKSIGDYALVGYNSVSSTVDANMIELNIPDTVENIGACNFYEIEYVTKFHLSQNIKSIGDYCFYKASGFTESLVLPDSLETLGSYCFFYLGSVEVTIGMNVTSIKLNFINCPNLTKITFKGTIKNFYVTSFYGENISIVDFRNSTAIPTLERSGGFIEKHASGCKIIVPDDLYDSWQTATNWSALTDVVWVKASEYVEE